MALIVAARPDPFRERMKAQKARSRTLSTVGFPRDFSHVRRPFRGIMPKGDTYATLDVVDTEGRPIPLINSGAREPLLQAAALQTEKNIAGALRKYETNPIDGREALQKVTGSAQDYQTIASRELAKREDTYLRSASKLREQSQQALTRDPKSIAEQNYQTLLSGRGASIRYSNFLITNVQETRQEKYQIMETFGAPYIFFFGERPRIYNFTGILLNSLDFQWRTEFWANYDSMLRGTRLVEMGARVSMSWDDIIAQGYILQATASEDSMQPNLVNFTFLMFITDYQSTANLGDPGFPTPTAVSIDTAYWKDVNAKLGAEEVPYTSNVDLMRRKNLEQAAQKKSPGLLGYLAMGLAAAHAAATIVTNGLEKFVKSFETLAAGRDVRYPVGAFPLLYEIQQREDLQQLLRGTNPFDTSETVASQIAEGISPETRRLIQAGADDPAGLPTFFVQDADLIVDLTQRYNKRAVRRIKILPPGGVFVPPTNEHYYGGLIRHNQDEYVQQIIARVEKYDDPLHDRDPFKEQEDEEKRLTDIIAHMVTKLRAMGAPMTDTDTLANMTVREGSSGALRLSMSSGGISSAFADSPTQPDNTMVDEAGDIAERQRAESVWANKQDPSTSPKADLDEAPIAQPHTVKIVTPDGIKTRPSVRRPVISGASINDPDTDKEALERVLKQARRRAARSS